MSSTKFEKQIDKFIDEDLNIELDKLEDEEKPKVYETIKYQEVKSNYPVEQTDEFEDYVFARTTIYETIRSLKFALNNAIKIADESEDPDAYAIVDKIAKNISEQAKELTKLRENRNLGAPKDVAGSTIEKEEDIEGSKNDVNKALDDLEDED